MTNTTAQNQPPEQQYKNHPILAEANIGDILTLTPTETDDVKPLYFRVTRPALDGCAGEEVGVENGEITWSSSLGTLIYTEEEELWFLEGSGWGFNSDNDIREPVEITDVLKTETPITQQEPLKCIGIFDGWEYSDDTFWNYIFFEGDPVTVWLENGNHLEDAHSYGDGDKMELCDSSGKTLGTLLSTRGYTHCRTCATLKNRVNKNGYAEHRETCNGTAWDAVIEYRDAEGRFIDRVTRLNGSPSVLWNNTWTTTWNS